MRKAIFIILVTGALGACSTAETRAQADDQTCRSYGANPGSDAYINCRSQLTVQRRQASDAALDRAIASCKANRTC